jgi:hypothetical protein
VAVRTQESQVLQPVVVVDPVDVVDMEHERLSTPLDDAADRAARFESQRYHPARERSVVDRCRVLDEDDFIWKRGLLRDAGKV